MVIYQERLIVIQQKGLIEIDQGALDISWGEYLSERRPFDSLEIIFWKTDSFWQANPRYRWRMKQAIDRRYQLLLQNQFGVAGYQFWVGVSWLLLLWNQLDASLKPFCPFSVGLDYHVRGGG